MGNQIAQTPVQILDIKLCLKDLNGYEFVQRLVENRFQRHDEPRRIGHFDWVIISESVFTENIGHLSYFCRIWSFLSFILQIVFIEDEQNHSIIISV